MKLTTISKKAVSLLISAVMLVSSLPVSSFAQSSKIKKELIKELEKMKMEDPEGFARDMASLRETKLIFSTRDFTVITDYKTGRSYVSEPKVLDQETLVKILNGKDANSVFGQVDTYAKYARIQAVEAKGGEHIMTKLTDGTVEVSDHVAKAGEWIVTNPGGEQYVVESAKFAKKYEKAAELGDGWFKPKGAPQKFRKIKYDMTIRASWGEEQLLRKGAYINVTDMSDIYGVAEKEFADTYKSIKTLYRESFNGIKRFVSKIEERMYKKYPRYKGVFFKKFLKNDTEYMTKQLEKKAAKQAAKKAGKKAALRTFGGVALGIGLYLGFTVMTAPTVEAQTVSAKKRGEVIRDLHAQIDGVKDAETKGEVIENMMMFTDPNMASVIALDANEGEGKLLDKMGSILPTVQASGFTEDEAAEFIAQQAVEENEEVKIPFVNPDMKKVGSFPVPNFG